MILTVVLMVLLAFGLGLVVGAVKTADELEEMAYEKAKRHWRRMEGL